MKSLLHIGTIIVSVIFLLVSNIVIIPAILGLFSNEIAGIKVSKHYFTDVLSINKALGMLGIILYLVVVFIVIKFNKKATKWINNL